MRFYTLSYKRTSSVFQNQTVKNIIHKYYFLLSFGQNTGFCHGATMFCIFFASSGIDTHSHSVQKMHFSNQAMNIIYIYMSE